MDDGHDPTYARAPEPDDLVRIGRALKDANARYVLIGGFAVIAHGGARFTKDIDLLIDDAPENVARVKLALGVLADNAAADVGDNDVRDFGGTTLVVASPATLIRTKDTGRPSDSK